MSLTVATLTAWIALCTPAAPAAQAAPTTPPTMGAVPNPTVLQVIDQQLGRGEIDLRTRHLYRVAALKRPSRLTPALRKLLHRRPAGPWRSGTHITRAAWRWVQDNNAWHGELHRLLQPPPDKQFVIDSDILPLRVSYSEPNHSGVAASVLASAEHSWLTEVDDYGFLAPPIEPGTERFRMYVEAAGAGTAGYLMPYDPNPATSWDDCFSYIVIDPSSSGDLFGVVAHEMSHATQAAMDCGEISTFWENTSTYIMSQVYPDSWDYTLYTMAYFQQSPWRPLDHMAPGADPFYEYGGALLLLYLTDTYAAPGEGGPMVAEIWTATMQDANADFNEPDYFDAIATVVGSRGGATDFDDIFMDFSEARYFVGDRDDGQHIRDAHTYYDAEVTLAARHWSSSLPVINGYVEEDKWPEEYGVAYVLLDLAGRYPYGLNIRFNGSDRTRWRVRLLRHGGGLETIRTDMELTPESFDGELTLAPSDHPKILLMAASLGPPGWEPESSSPRKYLFLYDIEPVLPPISVSNLTPTPVEQGWMALPMELHGDGFVDGAGFAVTFDDPGLHVAAINTVDPTRIAFLLAVDRHTVVGPHDVVVTNRDGTQAKGLGLLTVVERGALTTPEEDPPAKKGCGCDVSGAPGIGLPVFLALCWLLFLARRRV